MASAVTHEKCCHAIAFHFQVLHVVLNGMLNYRRLKQELDLKHSTEGAPADSKG